MPNQVPLWVVMVSFVVPVHFLTRRIELDEDGDELGVVLFGGRSPSGSSRVRLAGRAMVGGR